MKIAFKTLVFILSLMFMFSVDFMAQPSPRVGFLKEAQAIIGMPFTPFSYAGVARRTTRRVVATEAAVATTAAASATAAAASAPQPAAPPAASSASAVPIGTVVQALPAGCTAVVVNGVSYSDCKGVFYKAAFQGNNLVYVVVPKPFN
jgi:hypothetical protein